MIPKTAPVVAIVGGGLAGALAALAFARTGSRVRWIDRQHTQVPDIADGSILSGQIALAKTSVAALAQLGLPMADLGAQIRQVHISEQGCFGAVRLRGDDHRAYGRVVPAATLLAALSAQIQSLGQIECWQGQVQHCEDVGSELQLTLADGSCCHANLVLAADGVESPMRQALGIAAKRVDYEQSVVSAVLQTRQSNRGIAYERFTADGPLALLPTAARRSCAVLTCHRDEAQTLLEASDTAFAQIVQEKIGGRLGLMQVCGKRSLVPLNLICAERQVSGRVVLLGNAMRLLHPVAGQGFNLALRDTLVLADCVRRWPLTEALGQFVLRRYDDQKHITAFTDILARLFRGQALAPVRGMGLFALSRLPTLSTHLAQRLSGQGVHVPMSFAMQNTGP